MPLDKNASRAVASILVNIRRNINIDLDRSNLDDAEQNMLFSVALQIEGIRSRLMFYPPSAQARDERIISRITSELKQGLDVLIRNKDFMAYAESTIFHGRSLSATREETAELTQMLTGDVKTISEAIINLRMFVDASETQPNLFDSPPAIDGIAELGRAVPAQKVGPVQLAIRNGKLAIAPQHASPKPIDAQNVEQARSNILERGAMLLEELKSSNNDPRLIAEIERMNGKIKDSNNVVEIGVSNIGCGMMGSALRDEMSPALSSMLSTYTMSIDMYVAQFPDWNRFVEQAAVAQIEESDIVQIRDAAQRAVERLIARPDIVEADVPETFKKLIRLLQNPAQSGKRAAFAVLRSIENLISKAVSYAGELADKTAKKSVDKLSNTLSTALVAGLLTIAVSASTGVGPIAAKINELQWLKNAIEVVQDHLNKIKTGKD